MTRLRDEEWWVVRVVSSVVVTSDGGFLLKERANSDRILDAILEGVLYVVNGDVVRPIKSFNGADGQQSAVAYMFQLASRSPGEYKVVYMAGVDTSG